jgi:hypothetical protein
MADRLRPTGFWSYTRDDDRISNGRLSRLRTLLTDELQGLLGRLPKVHIFQDVAMIDPGTDWENEIHKALDQSSFFIPIVTPGFLQSEMCCMEMMRFRDREIALGRSDLIIPFYWIGTDDVDPGSKEDCYDPAVFRLVRSRQRINFQDLRFRDPTCEVVSSRIGELAESIRRALRRAVLDAPGSSTAGTLPTVQPSPQVNVQAPAEQVTRNGPVPRATSEGASGKADHRRGWLGISLQPITVPEGLEHRAGQRTARQVVSITPGGPADRAGLRSGDVLLTLDGTSTGGNHALRGTLARERIGSQVEVRLMRDGLVLTTILTVAAQPDP